MAGDPTRVQCPDLAGPGPSPAATLRLTWEPSTAQQLLACKHHPSHGSLGLSVGIFHSSSTTRPSGAQRGCAGPDVA